MAGKTAKSAQDKAALEQRYITACGAANAAELAPFLQDPHQGVRAAAAMNPDADADILDRFADDRFWGVRIEVIGNANVSDATLLRLLVPPGPRRGVVHHAAREKLEERGWRFGADGMPLPE